MAIPHTLQFTVVHAVRLSYRGNGFSAVSLSIQITHGVFVWEPKSLLAIIQQLPIPKTRLNLILLLPGSYLGRLASRNSTLHFRTDYYSLVSSFNCTDHTENSLYCWRGMFTVLLPTNRRPIVTLGNVFTESLPSNGSICHSVMNSPVSYLKHNISETGFCIRLSWAQMTELVPISRHEHQQMIGYIN
jgi:hypothetical protein